MITPNSTYTQANLLDAIASEQAAQQGIQSDIEIWERTPYRNGLCFYEISSFGRCRSVLVYKNGGVRVKIISTSINNSGYETARLGRMCGNHLVHRLVAIHHIPNPENKKTVNHKDGNKLNNNKNNLEWATVRENHLHAYSTGLKKTQKVMALNIETGETFLFQRQQHASKKLSVSRVKIYRSAIGKNVEGKYRFKYIN